MSALEQAAHEGEFARRTGHDTARGRDGDDTPTPAYDQARRTSGQARPTPYDDDRADSALAFKEVMSRFPTGVVAITGGSGGDQHALTVGSFFSVSAEPRLIGFCVARTSTSWPAISASGRFGVSVLAADQTAVSTALAARREGKLAGVPRSVPPGGAPVIAGAVAALDCVIDRQDGAGDHFLVVGRVLRCRVLTDGDPLVFHRRRYRRLSPPDADRHTLRPTTTEAAAMPALIDRLLAERLSTTVPDHLGLSEAGLQSMDIIRLVAELPLDPAAEIDFTELEGIRTLAQLRDWLARLLEEYGS